MRKEILSVFLIFFSIKSFSSTLELEWQHYISAPSLKSQLKDYVFLNWDQKSDFQAGPFSFNTHIKVKYAFDRSKIFYLDVPELYFFYEYELNKTFLSIKSIELNIGRKIKDWSLSDEYWGMGLWNSLNNWNPLHPASNGLIGSFLTLHSNKWSFDFFVGSLYVPNMEIQVTEENGRVYSGSRWFNPVPHQVNMFNRDLLDIRYLMVSPFILDILFQQSYLLSLKTWSKTPETYYWMKWSAADKPVNHLFPIVKTKHIVRVRREKDSSLLVKPAMSILLVRQRSLSAEWGFDYRNFSGVFSVENTRMKASEASVEGWTLFNQKDNFTYLSALMEYKFSPNNFVRIGYLHSWFQNYNINKGGERGKEKLPSVLAKYRLLEGLRIDWQKEFSFPAGQRSVFALTYQRSFLSQDAWLYAKVQYYISPHIRAELSADILGSQKKTNYLISRFRHNDNFSWRLAYDF